MWLNNRFKTGLNQQVVSRIVAPMFLVGSFTFSTSALAVTDGSGYLILEKMIVLVKTANDQLRAMRKNLDVTEYLKEMEQLKHVRQFIEGADQLQELIAEIRETESLTENFFSKRGTSYEKLEHDLERIKHHYGMAKDKKGIAKVEGYIRTVQQFKRLDMLKESNQKNMEQITAGMTEQEALKSTALSNATLVELLSDMEARQIAQDVINANADLEEHRLQESIISGFQTMGEHGLY